MKTNRTLWAALFTLVLLTPLGLLAAGTAWGEWGASELKSLVGYVPGGLKVLSGLWRAPLPDYAGPGAVSASFLTGAAYYLFSASLGVGIIIALVYLVSLFLVRKEPGASGRRRFAGKTLSRIARLLKDTIFSERYTQADGLLQRIDPRVKLLSVVVLLVAVSLARRLELLIVLYLWVLALAYLSRIPVGFFLKRVWVFIPLFSAVIALPALFSWISPGAALASFGPFTVTKPGALAAGILVSRVATSVSLAVLLVSTTRWHDVTAALRVFRVPRTFVLVLEMTYRYIFLFLKTAEDMHLARTSRVIEERSTAEGRRWIYSGTATLFRKSKRLSEEVYLAMLSRGFTGEVKSISAPAARAFDIVWLAVSIVVLVATVLINRGAV